MPMFYNWEHYLWSKSYYEHVIYAVASKVKFFDTPTMYYGYNYRNSRRIRVR